MIIMVVAPPCLILKVIGLWGERELNSWCAACFAAAMEKSAFCFSWYHVSPKSRVRRHCPYYVWCLFGLPEVRRRRCATWWAQSRTLSGFGCRVSLLVFLEWQKDVTRERELEKRGRDQSSTKAPSSAHHHPILGPQLAQLPSKRIHLTPAHNLAPIPVYEKQRAYRHDRVKVMAKDKKKHCGWEFRGWFPIDSRLT